MPEDRGEACSSSPELEQFLGPLGDRKEEARQLSSSSHLVNAEAEGTTSEFTSLNGPKHRSHQSLALIKREVQFGTYSHEVIHFSGSGSYHDLQQCLFHWSQSIEGIQLDDCFIGPC